MARRTRPRDPMTAPGLTTRILRAAPVNPAHLVAWALAVGGFGAVSAALERSAEAIGDPAAESVANDEPAGVPMAVQGIEATAEAIAEPITAGQTALIAVQTDDRGASGDTDHGGVEEKDPRRAEGRRPAGERMGNRATDGAFASPVRFGGRTYVPDRTIRMRVTAYSPDERSCGRFADGITASGRPVTHNGGFLVAADTRLLPFGTLVSVPGYRKGRPVPVLDRGGRIKGHRLDVLFPTHERAMQWGVQDLDVVVWKPVDEPGAGRRGG